MEGVSLVPLIKSPALAHRWKSAAFSQYPRMIVDGDVKMGYSLRSHTYRYTEWVYYDTFSYRPLWDFRTNRQDLELYDHALDPDENHNVAHEKQYAAVCQQLSRLLRAGWRAALPKHDHSSLNILL